MSSDDPFGYLLVHFVEDPLGYGEQVYFSLSDGDDACSWTRLNGGEPVLRSDLGTTGVRDPFLVRGPDGFFLVATDLRIYGGDDAGWEAWTRHGSRDIVVWRSADLLTWSQPWCLRVAPPAAGMAWAPEAVYDADRGEFLVFWSSALYDADDVDHRGAGYSRILAAWTPDFRTIGEPRVLIDRGTDVIDTTMLVEGGQVHRISKQESFAAGSDRVFHEVGPQIFSDEYRTVARRIGADLYDKLEAPLVFKDHRADLWYLFVDQYGRRPQGYVGFSTTDLSSGRWDPIPPDRFHMPPDTKHGGVLPLRGGEWRRLRATYGGGEQHRTASAGDCASIAGTGAVRRPARGGSSMSNHVYRLSEIVGSSEIGVDDAIRTAVRKASETVRNIEWFETTSVRGHVVDGEVAHVQVTMKIGFRVE